jgi:transposase
MKLHANAALSVNKRRVLCERVVVAGWTLTEAAEAAEVSVRCARKWVGRYRAEGEAGLLDRSSAPAVVANRTDERRIEVIAALRRLRFTGPEIAELLDMALSTVSGILTRIGMGRLGRLGLEPAARYERARPGELVHIDVKRLGRIIVPGHRITGNRRQSARRTTYTPDGRRVGDAGWEFVHTPSTTARAWPMPKCSPTKRQRPRSRFCGAPSGSSSATPSPSSSYSPTTARPTARPSTRSPAALWASTTCAPALAAPRPTARQSASSAPCSPAGPTARSTAKPRTHPSP